MQDLLLLGATSRLTRFSRFVTMAIHSPQYRSEQFILTISWVLIYAHGAGPAGEAF